MYGQDWNSV